MKLLLLAAFTGLVFTLTGCSTAELALDAQTYPQASMYPVEGRMGLTFNQSLKFGDFATSKVKRAWTTTRGYSNFFRFSRTEEEFSKKHYAYSFSVSDHTKNAMEVSCAINVDKNDLIWRSGGRGSRAYTKFQTSGILKNNTYILLTNPLEENDLWQLVLDNKAYLSQQKYAGYISQNDDEVYQIKPLTQLRRADGRKALSTFEVSGYEIVDSEDKPVAAVSLINKGVVYLRTQNPGERLLMAGVCSALLLVPHDVED